MITRKNCLLNAIKMFRISFVAGANAVNDKTDNLLSFLCFKTSTPLTQVYSILCLRKALRISGSKVYSSNMAKNYERRTVEIIHPQLRFYVKFFSSFILENHNGSHRVDIGYVTISLWQSLQSFKIWVACMDLFTR